MLKCFVNGNSLIRYVIIIFLISYLKIFQNLRTLLLRYIVLNFYDQIFVGPIFQFHTFGNSQKSEKNHKYDPHPDKFVVSVLFIALSTCPFKY